MPRSNADRSRFNWLCLAAVSLTSVVAAQPPLAHYPLHSDVRDAAGTNHGTFEGMGGPNAAATFVPDSVFGSVISLDGVDDRVNLGPLTQFQNNTWSLAFWFNTTDSGTVGLIGKNDGNTSFAQGERVFEITGPGSWNGLGANRSDGNFAVNGHSMGGAAFKRTDCGVDVALNDGCWHQVIVIHDGTQGTNHLIVYIDGVLASSQTGTFANDNRADVGSFYLGFSNCSAQPAGACATTGDYLKGKMAHVNFYTRTLDSIDLLVLHAPFKANLISSTPKISITAGGSHDLQLCVGPCHANRNYWVFGSITGTSPGTPLGAILVPLNADPYTDLCAVLVNTPVFSGFRGTLGAAGIVTASLNVPANQPIPIGTKLHHAAVVYDSSGKYHLASSPVELEFTR